MSTRIFVKVEENPMKPDPVVGLALEMEKLVKGVKVHQTLMFEVDQPEIAETVRGLINATERTYFVQPDPLNWVIEVNVTPTKAGEELITELVKQMPAPSKAANLVAVEAAMDAVTMNQSGIPAVAQYGLPKCQFCDQPVKNKRANTCGSEECLRKRDALYTRKAYARKKAAQGQQQVEAVPSARNESESTADSKEEDCLDIKTVSSLDLDDMDLIKVVVEDLAEIAQEFAPADEDESPEEKAFEELIAPDEDEDPDPTIEWTLAADGARYSQDALKHRAGRQAAVARHTAAPAGRQILHGHRDLWCEAH